MALVRWDPWTTLPTLQDRINRLFEDAVPNRTGGGESEMSLFDWRPKVDTYEEGDNIVIKADLPGVKKEDVSIDIKDNVLTLKGERKHEENINEENYYRRESAYGKFQRAFTLPDGVDPNKIEAAYKDGTLKITVPKAEKTKAKKIDIK
ncbi:MAG TPA: Hsp20/alpha crystallin family protein [Desulfosalsimonadaceae bacterium]|nr:Hsp20/alpha crystallin family protein [Desulfosalsimonadaceae bacterium]